jgi:hypothetical protein
MINHACHCVLTPFPCKGIFWVLKRVTAVIQTVRSCGWSCNFFDSLNGERKEMKVIKGQTKGWKGYEGWRNERNDYPLNFNGSFPLIFDECVECGWLGNTALLWNVGWRASTDSWAQTMWCIQEATQQCGGRKWGHSKAKAASSLPFVQRNADTKTSPALVPRAYSDQTSAVLATNPTSFVPSFFKLTNPTTSSIVTRLRTVRSGVHSTASARDSFALQIVQTDPGAQPASHLMGTRGSFRGRKEAGDWNWPLTTIY